VSTLRKAVQQEPRNKDAASWLATALWDSGQTTAALKQLRNTAQEFPSDCEVLFLLGEAYQKAANLELEFVTTNAVGTPVYHQVFGNIYADQHVWTKASGHFRAALEKDPAWKGTHFGLGEVYFHQGKWTEAQAEFEKETRIDPSSAAAFARLGDLAIVKDDIATALRQWNTAIQISPEEAANALGLPALPYLAAVDKPNEEAAAAYRRALPELNARNESPTRDFAIAALANQSGATEAYQAAWTRFVRRMSKPLPAGVAGRAKAELNRHDFASAETDLEAMLARDPRNMQLRYLAAKTYQYRSLSVLDRMLAIDSDFYRVHQLLAKTYERKDEDEKALAEYGIVEKMRPSLSGLHFAMGHLLWTMNEPDKALVELEKELALNPDHAEANAEIGTILVAKHQNDEAIPHLEKALRLKPDLAAARQQLGIACYQRKDFLRAELELKKSLPGDSEGTAHFVLGMVYRRLGRAEESRVALEASRKIRAERLADIKIENPETTP
jgi:tetratricopeptide (TPR) repeat protein